ncbi:MAG: type II toxin-antitoxin system HipA family toxin [Clostridiales Family XIII bacterium]|jgi:serine/threonine-protein kinase HipA|nr:type II toxin-antitoxin system HipA family toxin [Clostridiales Family XIII bacterium]
MAFNHAEAIEVLLFGQAVGALAADPQGRRAYAFEYFSPWLRQGFSISPLHLPLEPGARTFEGLAEDTWHRLPPAIADALPDRFGNGLIDAKLAEIGVTSDQITPLDRLSYVADRAMGALEFRPAQALGRERADIIDIAELVGAAREALHGSIATDRDAKSALRQLLSVGTSAGGMRAKAVVNIDPGTGAITSGQRPAAGKQSWLLKFDGVGDGKGLGASGKYGRIEYAYSLMAKDAGIDMPETGLLEENGRAHFMARRFDRIDTDAGAGSAAAPQKLHMQSLCAMGNVDFNLIHTNDYASLFAVIGRLGLGEGAATEAFRRMAFNYMAMNCDDHAKNFSFLADAAGRWRFAPAYDVTFAYNSQNIWLREHLMGVSGKFAGVTQKDLVAFANRHGVEYAKAALADVRAAIANWQGYANRAGLGKAAADEIAAHFG